MAVTATGLADFVKLGRLSQKGDQGVLYHSPLVHNCLADPLRDPLRDLMQMLIS